MCRYYSMNTCTKWAFFFVCTRIQTNNDFTYTQKIYKSIIIIKLINIIRLNINNDSNPIDTMGGEKLFCYYWIWGG